MSRIVRFYETGSPDVLRIEEAPQEEPRPDEVLLKIAAIGVNRSESAFRSGLLYFKPALPSRIGGEAVGTILKLGSDVKGFEVGDRVCVVQNRPAGTYGMYATETVAPADSLVKAPARLSDIEAAALWIPFVTAYGMLVEFGKLKPGEHVLILAASSSVGLAAIQVVKELGGVPIAATRTHEKAARLKAAGAAAVIVTAEEDITEAVGKIVGDKGIDILLDPVAGPDLERWAGMMAEEGRIFVFGGLSGKPTPYPRAAAMKNSLRTYGFTARSITAHPERFARAKEFILDGVKAGRLNPVIAKVFPFDKVAESHEYLETGQQFGKIVVEI